MQTKILACLVAALTLTSVSFAQFHVGAKAGVNMTKIDGQSFSESFDYGYHLGGFAEIGLGNKWALQPEVLFNQYNSKTTTEFSDIYQGESFKNVTLNYLSIPLLLSYTPAKLLSLQGGAQVGILMDKSKTLAKNGQDAFKNGDFSLLGGVQVNLGSFKVSGRYFVGLNNINDIDSKDKWRNQGFQLSLGFRII